MLDLRVDVNGQPLNLSGVEETGGLTLSFRWGPDRSAGKLELRLGDPDDDERPTRALRVGHVVTVRIVEAAEPPRRGGAADDADDDYDEYGRG